MATMQAQVATAARPLVNEPIWALGLMSGTSLDGVDAALIRTDGEAISDFGPALTLPYDSDLRERIRGVLGADKLARAVGDVARAVTLAHAEAVRLLLQRHEFPADAVKVVGFHGHTILHRPDAGITRQIGDGALLARLTGLPVVDDFRTADVAAGGQGAPLVPLFHRALAAELPMPLAVLNLGGVGNVTWIGSRDGDEDILAFDTGPGNALIDDWVRRHTGRAFDENGAIAAAGTADRRALEALSSNPFFRRPPPKSLDRNHFNITVLAGLPVSDGAATLAAFTAAAVARAQEYLPAPPRQWLVCGGGRHNAALMRALRAVLPAPVEPVETVGWDGDALEAQAFGFLAVRSLRDLPLSLPRTTGVKRPMAGGRLHLPDGR